MSSLLQEEVREAKYTRECLLKRLIASEPNLKTPHQSISLSQCLMSSKQVGWKVKGGTLINIQCMSALIAELRAFSLYTDTCCKQTASSREASPAYLCLIYIYVYIYTHTYWLVRKRNYSINNEREFNTVTFIPVELLVCYPV